MTLIPELQRRLRTLDALHEAVVAMKSLAAHHLRESRARVTAARAYHDGVARIAALVPLITLPNHGMAGLLVIGAELGLCGSYNSAAVSSAVQHRRALGAGPTLCIGRRGRLLLVREGVDIEKSYDGPTSVHGITDILLRAAEDILTLTVSRGLSTFHVVSSRFAGIGASMPVCTQLLPFASITPAASAIIRYTNHDVLAATAARELLFGMLFDALLGSLASEHGARLVATQSAERWLSERTDRLARRLTAALRESSTQEMLETAIVFYRGSSR